MADLLARLQAALADRYTIERELGRGGMATVYLARDLKHHRLVAIKVLRPELAAALGPERFLREIETAAGLNHPHILPLHDSGEAAGFLYYVMPFVEGETLRDRLNRERQLSLDEALQITRDVADALSYAHSHDVVHRDIKPENLLLEAGHAVVSDFGIARAIHAAGARTLTGTGLALGTPAYMSPEQAAGERALDGRSDIYSLGCVLYEMLAGEPPFTGPTAESILHQHLAAEPPRVTGIRAGVPEGIGQAIRRALAKTPADRFPTALAFAEAVRVAVPGVPVPAVLRRVPGRRALRLAGVAVVLVFGIGVARVLVHPGSHGALDPNLVAVAPFNVLDPKLALWREGLVDVLSRNFDGAGALRMVPPSIAIKRSSPHADAATAAELGRHTGARLVVFGTLTSEGPDSVRLTAGVVDARSGRLVSDVERRDLSDRMNRLADSLTIALLRALGELPSGGLPRLSSVGTVSLPALKAFLQGEQYFRRTVFDSALASYEHAIALDTAFALAWRRMSNVLGWTRVGSDIARVYTLRAAGLNRGLAPRDSILIVAESLFAALITSSADRAWRAHQARLFGTLDEATRHYPDDREVWNALGEARFHLHQVGRTNPEDVLDPFDRAIALDSGFGPGYFHPIELAFGLGRPEAARRYMRAYLAGTPTDVDESGLRLAEQLVTHPGAWPPALERAVDTTPANLLYIAGNLLKTWPDSAETAVRLAKKLATSRRSGIRPFDDQAFRGRVLAGELAYRGHLHDAYAVGGGPGDLIATMAPLGGVPAESAAALFRRWLADPPLREPPNPEPSGFHVALFSALPWWAARRDTSSLAAFGRRLETLTQGRSNADLKPWFDYGSAAARAYLALARADTSEATRRFAALPDTICPCPFDEIVAAQLLAAAGRDRAARRVFEGQPDLRSIVMPVSGVVRGLWQLQRARAEERVGERERAITDYRYVADLWRNADPELQPYVEEAKTALKRLGGERR